LVIFHFIQLSLATWSQKGLVVGLVGAGLGWHVRVPAVLVSHSLAQSKGHHHTSLLGICLRCFLRVHLTSDILIFHHGKGLVVTFVPSVLSNHYFSGFIV